MSEGSLAAVVPAEPFVMTAQILAVAAVAPAPSVATASATETNPVFRTVASRLLLLLLAAVVAAALAAVTVLQVFQIVAR